MIMSKKMNEKKEIKSYLYELLEDDERRVLEVISEKENLNEAIKELIGYKESE